MTYRDNVQRICENLGIANPIQEEDLQVKSISFRINGEWKKIHGTDMNRAGRLFFQYCYVCSLKPISSVSRKSMSGITTDGLHVIGRSHFGELWDDAEEKGRALIAAFKSADYVQVYFK